MASNGSESPRQKMINLMYIVLLAMLALNVSSDVLKGFSLVEEGLLRSTENSQKQNNATYASMEDYMKKNPEKVREWFEKAHSVRMQSDSLYNFIEELKVRIVQKVDGEKADVHNIQNKEDLEAASFVMLTPGSGQGKRLTQSIDHYRNNIISMVADSVQRDIIKRNLSTTIGKKKNVLNKNWAE